ncbi:Morphogenesis-related protein MSB1 [Neolecta irregularis DAH-3]|uniref:Morphogenesis-related protein MSB1 n=1 Tax=Neolecta irregularis (strain DAH-3) TaxID=1198029 RepID=A0A1U7LLK3_NEOID|nr:Morphogenesis-related protein MSB1 [Neolecta irregularis DAH-3]|eukprot:OLL23540.1 Morphogenesis-related protein MSB1 [Neolecta irregularis DAH-3]
MHEGSDGFDSGYESFQRAADATQHLFFAYLRSMAPAHSGPSNLPRILEKLLAESRYPPHRTTFQHHAVLKISLLVDRVSPSPFALLKRAVRHHIYNDSQALAELYACTDDPSKCLSDECARVLKCIAAVNSSLLSESQTAKGLADFTWSRFIDFGFDDSASSSIVNSRRSVSAPELSPSAPISRPSRPITPSWGEFLNDGFPSSRIENTPFLLSPQQSLPFPISQKIEFHPDESTESYDRGNIECVKFMQLDDAFWGVWIESLAAETVESRKAVFGRSVVAEIANAGWIVVEEKLRGVHTPQLLPPIDTKKRMFSKRTKTPKLKPINSVRRPLSPELQVSPQLAEMLRERYAAQMMPSHSSPQIVSQDVGDKVNRQESRITLGTEVAHALNWAGRDGRYVTDTTENLIDTLSPEVPQNPPAETTDRNPFAPQPLEASIDREEVISPIPTSYLDDSDRKDKNRIFKLFLHRRKTVTVPKLSEDPAGSSIYSRSSVTSDHPEPSLDSLHTSSTIAPVRRKPVPSQMLLPYDATPGEESLVSSNSTTPRADRWKAIHRAHHAAAYPPSEYDDGETAQTSDEESIEDRVARIKKRVAELTILSE